MRARHWAREPDHPAVLKLRVVGDYALAWLWLAHRHEHHWRLAPYRPRIRRLHDALRLAWHLLDARLPFLGHDMHWPAAPDVMKFKAPHL